MQRFAIVLAAILGGTAFLGMVKLMYDMTSHMARMTDQVAVMSADMGRMRTQMETLVSEVGGIRESVGHMDALATDVHGMRESVEAMAGFVHSGGEQMRSLNPLEMMQKMVPSGTQR
jgi:outer membrane murein-binding lipoprotein Lpp